MKSISNKIGFSIIFFILLSFFTFAQPGSGWRFLQLKDKLNLSEEQETQLEKLRLNHQKEMIDLKSKLEKARLELREVTTKENFSRNDFISAHKNLAKIREEIQLANANHRMDVFDLLNKDQRKMVNDFMNSDVRPKWRKGMGWQDCPYGFDGPRFRERKRIHW